MMIVIILQMIQNRTSRIAWTSAVNQFKLQNPLRKIFKLTFVKTNKRIFPRYCLVVILNFFTIISEQLCQDLIILIYFISFHCLAGWHIFLTCKALSACLSLMVNTKTMKHSQLDKVM